MLQNIAGRDYKIWAILACLLWGSAFVGAKIGFQYMGPLMLSGVRFVLAGVMLWPLLIIRKVHCKRLIPHWRFLLLFAVVQTFLQYGLFFMGLNRVPAATAAIIVGAGPLVIAVMAHFTIANDKMNWRKMLAILFGFVGIIFISIAKGQLLDTSWYFYSGVFLLILSILIGGATNILVAKYARDMNPIALTSVANFTGGVMLFICAFLFEEQPNKGFPSDFWMALCWLSFISAAGFSIWYTQLRRPQVKVSELNMWKFVIPVTGVILSWLILPNEYPDFSSIIGIVIITSAILLYQHSLKK